MVYYTKVLEANFDAFEKFRQIDGKLRALTLGGALKFKKQRHYPNSLKSEHCWPAVDKEIGNLIQYFTPNTYLVVCILMKKLARNFSSKGFCYSVYIL